MLAVVKKSLCFCQTATLSERICHKCLILNSIAIAYTSVHNTPFPDSKYNVKNYIPIPSLSYCNK